MQNPLIPSKRNDRLLKEQAERLAREKEAREIYEGKKDDVGGMAEGDKKEEGGGESGVESQESRVENTEPRDSAFMAPTQVRQLGGGRESGSTARQFPGGRGEGRYRSDRRLYRELHDARLL